MRQLVRLAIAAAVGTAAVAVRGWVYERALATAVLTLAQPLVQAGAPNAARFGEGPALP